MDEQVKAELLKYLEMIREATEAGGDFVLEQAPLVAQELVTLGRVFHTSAFIGGLVILFAVYKFSMRRLVPMAKKAWSMGEGSDEAFVGSLFGGMGAGFLAIFAAIMSCTSFQPCLTVWFAPRIYIIERIAELL